MGSPDDNNFNALGTAPRAKGPSCCIENALGVEADSQVYATVERGV